MIRNSVFFNALSRRQADEIVQELMAESFSDHDVSVICPSGPMAMALGDMARGLLSVGGGAQPPAQLYEDRVKAGRPLHSVLSLNNQELARAKQIWSTPAEAMRRSPSSHDVAQMVRQPAVAPQPSPSRESRLTPA